jgi:adenine C2-methylase RlmN of 23S rRNA A2503 and tRNA A37
MRKLYSELDRSVNFVIPAKEGYFEARYVSRPDKDYSIVYLSSQSGCSKACRMCHLTATRQVKSVDATLEDFQQQASVVLQHWDGLSQEQRSEHKRLHFNFMARGEALACATILDRGPALLRMLGGMAESRGLEPRFLISTIMPKSFAIDELGSVWPERDHYLPEIYYSIYSLSPEFRRKWLPQAMTPELALRKLARWQKETGKRPKIHFAFIKGENDSPQNVQEICRALQDHGLDVDVNIVRYNPPDANSQESDETVVASNAQLFQQLLPGADVRIIPRVGFDVRASCGTFFSGVA